MHEASVAERVLETVREYANLQTVYVLVGKESCVHPDMLAAAFAIVSHDTPVQGVELVALPGPGDDITVLSVEVDDGKNRNQPKRVRGRPPRGGRKPDAAP